MFFVLALLAAFRLFFRDRRDLAIEVLAVRQQVAVLKRKRPRPRLTAMDCLFRNLLQRTCTRWKEVLLIVQPETLSAAIAPVSASFGARVPDTPHAGQSRRSRLAKRDDFDSNISTPLEEHTDRGNQGQEKRGITG